MTLDEIIDAVRKPEIARHAARRFAYIHDEEVVHRIAREMVPGAVETVQGFDNIEELRQAMERGALHLMVTLQRLNDPQARSPDTPTACKAGCALCCVYPDRILARRAEASALYQAAEQVLVGVPDGRDWHPKACPVLDPQTRKCRIDGLKPLACQDFWSNDFSACQSKSAGEPYNADALMSSGVGLRMSLVSVMILLAMGEDTNGFDRYDIKTLIAALLDEGADKLTALERARVSD